jgi:hypothetical protein
MDREWSYDGVGMEPGGWSGGIGAGIGVTLGQIIAAKKSKDSDLSSEGTD